MALTLLRQLFRTGQSLSFRRRVRSEHQLDAKPRNETQLGALTQWDRWWGHPHVRSGHDLRSLREEPCRSYIGVSNATQEMSGKPKIWRRLLVSLIKHYDLVENRLVKAAKIPRSCSCFFRRWAGD